MVCLSGGKWLPYVVEPCFDREEVALTRTRGVASACLAVFGFGFGPLSHGQCTWLWWNTNTTKGRNACRLLWL
jgi:hypothetical protein